MGKANSLKNDMKGGLNGLISSTSSPAPEAKAKKEEAAPEMAGVKKAREVAVHCNLVIDKSLHTRMKVLAAKKNVSLRDVISQALKEYLQKYEE